MVYDDTIEYTRPHTLPLVFNGTEVMVYDDTIEYTKPHR